MNAKVIAHLYLAATIVTTVYSQLVIKWRIGGRFAGLKIPDGVWPKIVTLFTVLFDPFVFSGLVATFVHQHRFRARSAAFVAAFR